MAKRVVIFLSFFLLFPLFGQRLSFVEKIDVPDSFFAITDFCVNDGTIFMLDRRGCQLFVNGKVKNLRGQGPGETVSPRFILIDKKKFDFVIVDSSTLKINVYNNKFIFKQSFRLNFRPFSVAVYDGKIAVSYYLQKNKIDVFDFRGNLIAKIVKKDSSQFDSHKLTSLLGKKLFFDEKGFLYACDVVSGKLEKFNRNFQLVYTKKILKDDNDILKNDKNEKIKSPLDPKILVIAKRLKKLRRIVDIKFDFGKHLIVVLVREKEKEKLLFLRSEDFKEKFGFSLTYSNYVELKIDGNNFYLLDEEGTFIKVFSLK